MSSDNFLRGGAVTAAAVVLLAAVTACSGAQPSVPDYTADHTTPTSTASVPSSTSSATAKGPATTSAFATPGVVPTTDSQTQTAFALPSGMDAPTIRMVQTYVAWETAYRRSMAAAKLDPSVSELGAGQAVTVATTTVSYLHAHNGTLVGPWRLTVSEAKASSRVGVLRLCIAGGSQIFDGKKSGFAEATAETVTLNDAGSGWRVTNYDDSKQACA